jgi:GH25 family lysozyme M1 (1,4-beta-N-acetylmuramidase)
MIKGLDVSKYQGSINFDLLKPVIDFFLTKATEGNGYTDPQFSRNQTEARRVDLPRGYYHFARPDLGNTPQHEASYFLSTLGNLQDGEVLCLDFEVTYGDAVNWCKQFLDYVYNSNKIKPLIYLNQSQVKAFNWQPIIEAGYGLWLAEYDYNPDGVPAATPWPVMALRQYTDKATFPGISGNVDGDVFYGDVPTFKKYGYLTPPPASNPSQPTVVSDPQADIDIGVVKDNADKTEDLGVQKLFAVRSMLGDRGGNIIELDAKIAQAQIDYGLLQQANDKLFKAINDPVSESNPTGGYIAQLKNAKIPTSWIAKLAMQLFG